MSQRTFKKTTTTWAPASRSGVQKASRLGLVSARRAMYAAPRSVGALAVTERKYFDAYLSAGSIAQSVDWAGTEVDPATLNTLFAPQEGSDINNRVGRKVAVHKITLRGSIYVPTQTNQTAADQSGGVRIILFQDMQTNGSQAQGEQLMAAPGAASAALAICTSQSTANFGRFRVLKDQMMNLKTPPMAFDGTNIEQAGFYQPFKYTVRFRKPVIVRFNATNGGTVADIVDNSFHVLAICASNALSPAIYYQARTVYTDA